jgi:chemotaxis protein methyltransferase CheR
MSDALARVANVIRSEIGIVVKEVQFPALAAALGRVDPGMDAERFLAGVDADRTLIERLADEVTIQETYFFREPRELRAIDWQRLLAAARERGADTVQIWVPACATGEDAYSLAILAAEALGSDPPVSILGTDISGPALQAAESGRYSGRSLRNLEPETRERHFPPEDDRHRVRLGLRSLVRFRHHNLVSDPSPPLGEIPFDVIACRNVLIYFDRETVESVVRSLESALNPDGYLILGAADRLTGTTARLDRLALDQPVERRRTPAPEPERTLRRPLGVEVESPNVVGPGRRAEDRIEDALRAADAGDLEAAVAITEAVLARDALDADAYFVRGLAQLGLGDPQDAVTSLRRALYIDPSFGLAAFKLGRAHDATGDERAARRAYEQALRVLDPEDERHRAILDQVDLGDVAAACRARLSVSTGSRPA